MPLRLQLFGAPRVERDGASAALAFERRSQLLAYLALKRSWVARAELAALLWPDQSQALAHANLRKTLFRLASLPWGDAVEAQGGALRVDVATDVADFDAALHERRIDAALALCRGELLAGFDDDANEAWSGWLGFERERARVAWRGAALARLDGEIDPAEGIALSARLLEADPLDEAALRAQMAWLARSGQGARARQAYRDFAARLAAELGLAPGSELAALHEALGAPAGAMHAATAPAFDAGFVGRSVERRRIAELLARDDCRLLCLIGPGGVGKTRLARHAMHELGSGFADGAAFVALEDVAATVGVGPRLARELGVGPAGGTDALKPVIEYLRERQLLLVLDNLEHLAAPEALLEQLLQSCARLKIVVTSRVRPAVAQLWSLPLDGLPVPEPEDQDRIEAFDAVRLFVDAARRVEPGLNPAGEAAAIAEICRQVDGLPLALELAAAWTRVLPCAAIAAELRRGVELLRSVDAARPARHASIEQVFEQSWRLLTPVERDTLARLAVFRGGFTAESARAVAAVALPVLGALADKSLLRKEGARDALHPLVQQLAAARLGEDRAATEAAHARHFLRLLAERRRAVEASDPQAMRQLDAEFENCRAAWRWALAHGQVEALAKCTMTLLHYGDHRGRVEETLDLLNEAVACPAVAADPRLAPLLASAVAHLEYRLDRYAAAAATATRALAAARATRDLDTRLQCAKVLGGCSLRLGRLRDARRWFVRALQQSRRGGELRQAAAMLDNLALVEKAMGHFDVALRMSMQSLLEHRRVGDAAGEALCLNNLGALQVDRGDHAAGSAHLQAGLALCERHGLAATRALVLANLAELALKTGDLDGAEGHAQRALEHAEAAGLRAIVCWLKLLWVRLGLRRADLTAARRALCSALELAIAIGRPALQIAGVVAFAELLEAQGEREGARRVFAFASAHPAIPAQEREQIGARLAAWGDAQAGAPALADAQAGAPALAVAQAGAPAWGGPDLDELAQRIVVEADTAHAALIAAILSA